MNAVRAALFAVCLLVFVSSRYIPRPVLKVTVGSYLGVIFLLAAVLIAARYDLLLALAVFLAAGSLFLENRKRVLMALRPVDKAPLEKTPDGAPVAAVTHGADDLIDGEEHPEHEEPDVESYKFEPTNDATDEFNPVGESINTKIPLETVSASSNKGLAEHLTREGVV
jgi:hypothetical protein